MYCRFFLLLCTFTWLFYCISVHSIYSYFLFLHKNEYVANQMYTRIQYCAGSQYFNSNSEMNFMYEKLNYSQFQFQFRSIRQQHTILQLIY